MDKVGSLLKGLSIGLALLLLFILVVALVIVVPQKDRTASLFTDKDFSNILGDNIRSNPRIVDISMLGAHDAFSSKIERGAEIDPNDGSVAALKNPLIKGVAGGIISRLSKTQKSSATDLLKHGVRYFDTRITHFNNSWYTMHGQISAPLEETLVNILHFLERTQGEFIIFDMQHVYLGESSFEALFEYIETVKINGKSLFDYVYYSPTDVPLATLHYSDVTDKGSGLVITAKTPQYVGGYHYNYSDSVHSIWSRSIRPENLLSSIYEENALLSSNREKNIDKLRVSQAQRTAAYGGVGDIMQTIRGWSMLDMAEEFNAYLIDNIEDFTPILKETPIFATDYSDSMKNEFNEKIVREIARYNASL